MPTAGRSRRLCPPEPPPDPPNRSGRSIILAIWALSALLQCSCTTTTSTTPTSEANASTPPAAPPADWPPPTLPATLPANPPSIGFITWTDPVNALATGKLWPLSHLPAVGTKLIARSPGGSPTGLLTLTATQRQDHFGLHLILGAPLPGDSLGPANSETLLHAQKLLTQFP